MVIFYSCKYSYYLFTHKLSYLINKSSFQLHQENERGINQIINLGGQNADHIIEEFGKEEGGREI